MGQNFLIDSTALDQIVAAAELSAADLVVEVGPGLGVLTYELVQRAGLVIAIELDKRLAARLPDEFPNTPLRVVQADVLRIAPAAMLGQESGVRSQESGVIERRVQSAEQRAERIKPEVKGTEPGADQQAFMTQYKVVANLPYAITAPVLRHFLEGKPAPELMVVLVQWEVAKRICAGAGDLSVLAHSVQLYAETEIVARVPSTSFFPAPAVDSAVLRLRRRPQLAVEVDNIDAFFRVIKAGFLQSRKKLSNSLPGGLAAMGQPLSRERAVEILKMAGVDPERRAETVTLAEWAAVYSALK
ncbi:16S rRNA (adenine(1518)-N(6)/adenine(1519)-N(6))-dimethyltransferase [Candidatus Gracilibacteria bacterium]|nr:16S rRNA (adenine(1518)-N(6)/adenine(1519)-N(6))-dimethyltransferase [Candidatus Gracilibacteria bacterium]